MSDDAQRLNKFLALQLGVSRRQADDIINAGKIKINGNIAKLGARFLDEDKIEYNGKMISTEAEEYVYILFNKPTNFVCSRRKQGENETIYTILPKKYHSLKPVGRLDKDSSGLLILTNDGDFNSGQYAKKSGKIPTLSETGMESIKVNNYFTQVLWPAMKDYKISYVLFWRNAFNKPEHFYVPYEGHGSAIDFKNFTDFPSILLNTEINSMYK
jgi:ribosomal 50S subunit-recycling heat shock protein